jgi:hypothetical protein
MGFLSYLALVGTSSMDPCSLQEDYRDPDLFEPTPTESMLFELCNGRGSALMKGRTGVLGETVFSAERLCRAEAIKEVWLGRKFISLAEPSRLEDFYLILLAMTMSKNLLFPAGALGIFSSITGKGLSGSSSFIDSLGNPSLYPSMTLFEEFFGEILPRKFFAKTILSLTLRD